jgi:divalent metal cation (Fe/Co/Zn/Cd) transporter
MSTEQAHAIAHEVQHQLRKRRPDIRDVTIHVEPFGSPPEEPGRRALQRPIQEEIVVHLRRLTERISESANQRGMGVHDVWAYEVDGRYYVELHLEADGALPLRQAHEMASSLEERAHAEIPYLAELAIHIEPQGQLIWASNSGVEETLRQAQDTAQVAQAVRQVINDTLNAEACHRVRVRRGYEGWAVSLHCQLPGEISLAEAHRISIRLETRLQEEVPGLERVVIHTEPRPVLSEVEGEE